MQDCEALSAANQLENRVKNDRCSISSADWEPVTCGPTTATWGIGERCPSNGRNNYWSMSKKKEESFRGLPESCCPGARISGKKKFPKIPGNVDHVIDHLS